MLRRNLRMCLEHFQDQRVFDPYKLHPLDGMVKPPPVEKQLVEASLLLRAEPAAAAGAKPKAAMANELRSPVGTLARGDLLMVQDGDKFRAAFAKLFVRLPDGQFVALVELLKHEQGTRFSAAQMETCFVKAEALCGAFPFMQDNTAVYVVASADIFADVA